MRYSYAMKGDPGFEYVSKKEQEEALETLLKTLEVEQLTIPQELLKLFPPRAYGYNRDRESFKSETGVAFDPVAAAVTSAEVTLDFMLNATRLNRMAQQGIYGKNLELNDMMEELTETIYDEKTSSDYEKMIQQRLKELYLNKLLIANNSSRLNVLVKSNVKEQITAIQRRLIGSKDYTDIVLNEMIKNAEEHPETIKEIPVQVIPDGSPIGSCGM
jgi:hypothetical protein